MGGCPGEQALKASRGQELCEGRYAKKGALSSYVKLTGSDPRWDKFAKTAKIGR
jgi:hypothetical protein